MGMGSRFVFLGKWMHVSYCYGHGFTFLVFSFKNYNLVWTVQVMIDADVKILAISIHQVALSISFYCVSE